MRNKKALTIFTPTFNRKKLLNNAYNSLIKQDCKDFVWMIIDDGSNDDTKFEVEKWIKENKISIKYFYKRNGGKHTAFNFMLKKVSTDYVLLSLDSDDTLLPDCVSNIYKDLESLDNEVGIIYPRPMKQNKYMISNNFNSLNNERKSLQYICSIGKMDMETEIVVSTAYLKKFKYPVYDNEKFFSENYIYYQMNEKFLWRNIPICIGEYQSEGLSLNALKSFINNPNSWCDVNKIRMNLKKSVTLKIKYRIYYIIFGLLAKRPHIISNANNQLLTIALFPIGYFGFFYLRYRAKEEKLC